MRQSLDSCYSFLRIFLEHSAQQIQGVCIKFFILISLECYIACPILCEHLIVGFTWKGTHSKQEDVEDKSQTENVANRVIFGLHVFDIYHLGSHIAWSTASDEQILFTVCKFSKSEVSNNTLPAVSRSEKYILRFEVTMHDTFAMHFSKSQQYRMHDNFGLLRSEFILSFNFIIELSSFQQLHNNIEGVLRLKNLMQFHASSVVQSSHYFYLLDQTLLSFVLTVCCFFGEGLDGQTLADLQFLGEIDRCKVTFAYFLLRLELLMKTSLVQFSLQNLSASLYILL